MFREILFFIRSTTISAKTISRKGPFREKYVQTVPLLDVGTCPNVRR